MGHSERGARDPVDSDHGGNTDGASFGEGSESEEGDTNLERTFVDIEKKLSTHGKTISGMIS